MKALLFAFLVLAGQAWGAIAPGTTVLLDLEDNLTDSSGLGNNATLVSTANYQTNGAWHGSKAFRSSAGSFTVPTGTISTAGTIEVAFRHETGVAGAKVIYSIAAAAGSRALEIYCLNGASFYAYGNGVGGTNAAFFNTVANSTNYYIKDTWDGAGNRQIWVGVWTVPGTVTLTQYFNSTATSVATPSAVYFANSSVGAGIDGGFDWIRIRNVYDNSSTVTVDPSGASGPLSPYIKNTNKNWMMPKLFLFLDKFFCRPVYALESNNRLEQAKNVFEMSKVYTKLKNDKILSDSLKLSDDIAKGKVTFTRTPTKTPSVTATRTPVI